MSWVGTAITTAGALTKAIGGASAKRKQNNILAEGEREQSRAGMQSSNVLAGALDQLRASTPNPEAERGAFTAALGAPGISALPTASGAFKSGAATTATGVQGYGARLADLFSRIRAPALQRQNENVIMANAGDTLRPIQMQSQNADFLTNLRAGQVQENPWVQFAGNGLSNLGQQLMARGFGSKKPPYAGGPATGVGAALGGNTSDLLTSGPVT